LSGRLGAGEEEFDPFDFFAGVGTDGEFEGEEGGFEFGGGLAVGWIGTIVLEPGGKEIVDVTFQGFELGLAAGEGAVVVAPADDGF